jgi:hypothetical protein
MLAATVVGLAGCADLGGSAPVHDPALGSPSVPPRATNPAPTPSSDSTLDAWGFGETTRDSLDTESSPSQEQGEALAILDELLQAPSDPAADAATQAVLEQLLGDALPVLPGLLSPNFGRSATISWGDLKGRFGA